jgi:hypothetical protein
VNKSRLFALAGFIWSLAGLLLIYRGWEMYALALETQNASQQAIIISLVISIIIGTAKGKFVLSKTARRNKSRIDQLEGPLKPHHVYAKPFYFFILGMISLGIALRFWNEFIGGYIVVGAIYVGIGIALCLSSLVYWKPEPMADNRI